jgi:hypothetical protein
LAYFIEAEGVLPPESLNVGRPAAQALLVLRGNAAVAIGTSKSSQLLDPLLPHALAKRHRRSSLLGWCGVVVGCRKVEGEGGDVPLHTNVAIFILIFTALFFIQI